MAFWSGLLIPPGPPKMQGGPLDPFRHYGGLLNLYRHSGRPSRPLPALQEGLSTLREDLTTPPDTPGGPHNPSQPFGRDSRHPRLCRTLCQLSSNFREASRPSVTFRHPSVRPWELLFTFVKFPTITLIQNQTLTRKLTLTLTIPINFPCIRGTFRLLSSTFQP